MQVVPEYLAHIFFMTVLPGAVWIPIAWLVLSFLTPKKLLEKYFKEPHFTLTETVLMAQFPGFLLRTGIFGWLLLFPALDKKRNIKNVGDEIPRWYSVSLKVFMVGAIVTFFVMITLLPILLLL